MIEDHNDDQFLDVREAARLLQMSQRFIYNLLRCGEGPRHCRLGNRYRIQKSELIRWAKRKGNGKCTA